MYLPSNTFPCHLSVPAVPYLPVAHQWYIRVAPGDMQHWHHLADIAAHPCFLYVAQFHGVQEPDTSEGHVQMALHDF